MSLQNLRLSHYSATPLKPIRSTEQSYSGDYRSEFDKPKGLWVSVDGSDDWEAWCRAENFNLGALTHRYRVTLAPNARVLLLQIDLELDKFTKRYGRGVTYSATRGLYLKYIAWEKVAQDYQGIIIAPYVWNRRMDLSWYYGWDCASGCIWDAAAVASVSEDLQQERAA